MFFGFFIYYYQQGAIISISGSIVLFPVYVLLMALLGLGLGMIISSMTTKYRDLTILVGFGVSLLMYISAVPYPVSEARAKFPENIALIVEYNPLTQIIEGFRYMLLETGTFSWIALGYTAIVCVLLFLIGLVVFNHTEKNFIDTV